MSPWLSPLASSRARRILRSAAGAFDLPSIITGVVVVGILAAGVLAAIFGVIPFAQDNGARQDLSSVRTAEGVAKAKDGRYFDYDGLKTVGYLNDSDDLAVGSDADGTCWVGIATSGSGAMFYATSVKPDPQPFTAGTDTGCLSAEDSAALAGRSAGAAPPVMAPAGSVTSWGMNTYKVLGDDSTADRSRVPVAVGAMEGKSVTQVVAGGYFSCAVADGAAYCWGDNTKGQLGNNSLVQSGLPVAVDTTGVLSGKTVTALAAGAQHTCAVADGAAYCWGLNSTGQLGNGTNVDSSVPTAVATSGVLAGKTVTALSAGNGATCAIAAGAAYCWGAGGMLGDGSSTLSTVPVAVLASGVLAGKTVSSIVTGSSHTCVVAQGGAFCWGLNTWGQLGNGGYSSSNIPVAVRTDGALSSKTITSLGAGLGHTCAVADGAAYCWGYNTDGQLGVGHKYDIPLPTAVIANKALAGKTVTSVDGGDWHSCAVADGAAYCWGMNIGGQLGSNDPTGATKVEPVAVATDGVLAGKTVSAVSTGRYHSMALYK